MIAAFASAMLHFSTFASCCVGFRQQDFSGIGAFHEAGDGDCCDLSGAGPWHGRGLARYVVVRGVCNEHHPRIVVRLRFRLGPDHPGSGRARYAGAAAPDRLRLRCLRQQDRERDRAASTSPRAAAPPTYDARGQFVTGNTNALGQSESWQFDARFGKADQPDRTERTDHDLEL